MVSNYDNSAFFYDPLSRIIFGKALIQAQVYLLKLVPPNSSILIAGGGTGWILEELSAIHYSGLNIIYVEISSKMMELAQKRQTGINKVTFVNDAIENTYIHEPYDVVITPFLFDNFSEQTLNGVFSHIHRRLKVRGIWLCSDFQLTGKLWQKMLLRTMYLFFKIICRIETADMPNIGRQFVKNNYKKLAAKTFYGNFIISTEYQKT